MRMCKRTIDLDSIFLDSRLELSYEEQAHVASCEDCKAYFNLMRITHSAGKPSVVIPDIWLSDAIASKTFARPSWLDAQRPRLATLSAVAAVMALVAVMYNRTTTTPSVVGANPSELLTNLYGQAVQEIKPIRISVNSNAKASLPRVSEPQVAVLQSQLKQRPAQQPTVIARIAEPTTPTHRISSGLTNRTSASTTVVSAVSDTLSRVRDFTPRKIDTTLQQLDRISDVVSSRASNPTTKVTLASYEEEEPAVDLRELAQESLNVQSSSFRGTAVHSLGLPLDTGRVNVVTAPVSSGGK